MPYTSLAQEIIEMQDADLALRADLMQRGLLNDGYHAEMQAMHDAHAFRLGEMMKKIGYPTIAKLGKEANSAAWLIIQHAIAQPNFMRASCVELQKAVASEEADPIQYAYLSDRIAYFEGKPQLYGTQFDWDEQGQMSPALYDDQEKVNARRAELGMNSLEEQITAMRARVLEEGGEPPKNFEERRVEFELWRKRVGWAFDSAQATSGDL